MGKKGGQIRLVVDAREPNRMHRPPPHTALGTPAALGEQDWTNDALGLQASEPSELWGSALDLQDSFYQFENEILGEDFGFDFPEAADVYGCTHVWSATGLEPVPSDEPVFPVFCGVPMGWSWALWAIHSIVSHESAVALGGYDRLIKDRETPPSPQSGRPTASVYVDNVRIFGTSRGDADKGLHKVLKRLEAKGLACHEIERAATEFDTVGLRCKGKRKILLHTDHRAWRLHLGTLGLIQRRRAAGWQLRVWLGHAVHFCMLARPLLSIFSATYKFVMEHLNDYVTLWPSVVQELQDFADGMFLAVVHLASPYSDEVFCSDSSKLGYALHVSTCKSADVKSWSAVREHWRFIPEEKLSNGTPDLHPGWAASWRASEGRINPEDWTSSPPPVVNTRPNQDHTHAVDMVECTGRVPRLPDSLLEPDRWKLVVEGAWKSTSGIHTLEARISLLGLRRASRSVKSHGKRVLSLGDNMAEIVASEKGRASDFSLRSLIKRSAAYQLGCGIIWRRRHVDTKRNISDFCSRKADRGVYKPGEHRVGPGLRQITESNCKGSTDADPEQRPQLPSNKSNCKGSTNAYLEQRSQLPNNKSTSGQGGN